IGEVSAARWEHLDLEGRTYEIRGSLVNRAGVKAVKKPKTRESEKRVRLSPACCEALRAHRVALAAHQLATPDYQDNGLIWAKPDGRIWEAQSLRLIWAGLLDAAGLPHVRFHDLRHTCAALLIDQGAHPKVIQEQMRHTSIRTTLDTYGHLFPARVDEAVAKLDQALGLAG
ncbi:MAG: site-specific integrase, partial [Candidatus Handelsmanbacteria bacterium]|nr:site-specific integrase [Candidatus Handelsmanbacteria bacterium]